MKMIYFEENRVSSHINFQARVQLATSFTLKNVLLFVSDSSLCKMKYKPIRSSTYN